MTVASQFAADARAAVHNTDTFLAYPMTYYAPDEDYDDDTGTACTVTFANRGTRTELDDFETATRVSHFCIDKSDVTPTRADEGGHWGMLKDHNGVYWRLTEKPRENDIQTVVKGERMTVDGVGRLRRAL